MQKAVKEDGETRLYSDSAINDVCWSLFVDQSEEGMKKAPPSSSGALHRVPHPSCSVARRGPFSMRRAQDTSTPSSFDARCR